MPAIIPSRLKIQTADLMEVFYQPAAFRNALHDLLNSYADHTHRSGQSGTPPPLIVAYNVPAPVIRQILKEAKVRARQDSPATFSLCDTLWEEPYLEFRILAAGLLGQVNPDPPEPVLDRIRGWLSLGMEDRLLVVLLFQGLDRMRDENFSALLELIQEWLNTNDLFKKRAGLIALKGCADDHHFTNLPVVFRLISPFVRIAPLDIRSEILSLLSSLVQGSPQETAFLLRQNLTTPDNPDTSWVIRQVLTKFPPEIQHSLRDVIKRQ